MSKSNKLIIAILVTLVTLSVAYALFSETINITGNATASGALELEFVDVTHGGSDDKENIEFKDFEVITEGNRITVTGELLKPGSTYMIDGYIKNVGTVDAKFIDVVGSPSFNGDLCEIDPTIGCPEDIALKLYKDEKTGISFMPYINTYPQDNLILKADDSDDNKVPFELIIEWNKNWDTAITEPQKVEFTATFNFVQAQ